MPKGSVVKTEAQILKDEKTGAKIRQITDHPSINHHPFFFVPAYDSTMNWLFFISYREGEPQIFCEEIASGCLVQLTDKPGLSEWSVYPSRNGRFILFVRDNSAWRLELDTFKELELVSFEENLKKETGMVGPAMGTTALSHDDRLWAVPIKSGERFQMYLIDTQNGNSSVIMEDEKIGHPQFCPEDNNLLLYLGTMTDPVWLLDRSKGEKRRLYKRDVESKQWITHAAWIPGYREVSLVDWPKGVLAVQVDKNAIRQVININAWHAISSPDGKQMVADTHYPDIGLQLFSSLNATEKPKTLCYPNASQLGSHWGEPFPYDDGPIRVYAPQYTHPHPSFAPDMSRIVYTSDQTGFAQVYECYLA